MKMSILR